MEKRLNLEDYKYQLNKKEYEQIRNEIANKSIELAIKIAKIKNIELDLKENLEDKLFDIKFTFNREIASFRGMIYLMNDLINWNCEDIYEEVLFEDEEVEERTPIETSEEKIQRYINRYNRILAELKQYQDIENEIKEIGYSQMLEQRKEKLIQLFKGMLEYKHKEYNENWDFKQFAEKINQYYNIYSDSLWNAVSASYMSSVEFDIEEDSIPINEIESIMFLDDFYNELTCKDDDYKNYADFYTDFELEDGQTFRDLYNLEIKKFIELFKDMLDFQNIEYDKNDNNLERLKWKVMKVYPYYHAMLFRLISSDPNVTYIQELDSMERVYNRIANEYKNHEENLLKYKDYMELLKKEGYHIDN